MSTIIEDLKDEIEALHVQLEYQQGLEIEKIKNDRILDLMDLQKKWGILGMEPGNEFCNLVIDLLNLDVFDEDEIIEEPPNTKQFDDTKQFNEETIKFIKDNKPIRNSYVHGQKGMSCSHHGTWRFQGMSFLTKRVYRQNFGKGEEARIRCEKFAKGVWAKYPNISV